MGRKTRQNKITSPELIAQINPNAKIVCEAERFVYFLRVGTPKCGQQVFPGD